MKKFFRKALWYFDRSYSSNRVWKPALWVVGMCVCFMLVFWLLGLLWGPLPTPMGYAKGRGVPRAVETMRLLLSPGNFPINSPMPYLYQLLIALGGGVVFTAFLISTFSNFLTNRVTNHRKGYSRYYFDNHVLVIGGSNMVVSLLNTIALDREYAGKNVVVLSNQDAETLWGHLVPRLSPEAHKMVITIYFGERNMDSELRSCQVENASHIFIVGEDDEKGHDAQNVECWKRVRSLHDNASQMAQCFLFLESDATTSLFHMLPQESHTSLETTVINYYESIAQQLLAGGSSNGISFTLDRGLVTAQTDRYVHLVVVGMTNMGCAMATTAAHLCHFPNFDENAARPIRTRITFVDPHADELMNQFKGCYHNLFKLSHSVLRYDKSRWLQGKPDSRYGDFLDVEWEFLKGTFDDEWIQETVSDYVADKRQVLSLAFCADSPEENVSHATRLPLEFYMKDEAEKGFLPVIYVYQPLSGALLDTARNEVPKFANIVPFGVSATGYDPLLMQRIAAAKRVNYLYQKEYSGKEFVSMPNDGVVFDEMWRQLSIAEKMSNVYSANSAEVKLRSVGILCEGNLEPVDDAELVEVLSRMEHSRWNIEKLLVGFSAMEYSERSKLNAALKSEDAEVRQEARMLSNRSKNQRFVHKDIAPYSELSEQVRAYDRAIVRNLPLALLPHIYHLEADAQRPAQEEMAGEEMP